MFNIFKKSEPNFCVDCIYSSTFDNPLLKNEKYSLCFHPKLSIICPVTGQKIALLCSTNRTKSGKCGPKGKYFELKQV
jgi:hypothetical protein